MRFGLTLIPKTPGSFFAAEQKAWIESHRGIRGQSISPWAAEPSPGGPGTWPETGTDSPGNSGIRARTSSAMPGLPSGGCPTWR